MINLSMADAGIAAWRGKLAYNFWRPITAIQLADTDGNPFTAQDGSWTPLLVTPPYPDYPSGLNSLAGAALRVLSDFFGENTYFIVGSDSPTMAGVIRAFPNFDAAASEIVDVRVWSGIHFRFADEDARDLGRAIANYVIANAFQPLHGKKNGQLR
jgi:hypothetical protein